MTDKELITALRETADKVSMLKRELYHRRPGCACDEKGLCAHHAEVYNRLVVVANDMEKVIQAALRNG